MELKHLAKTHSLLSSVSPIFQPIISGVQLTRRYRVDLQIEFKSVVTCLLAFGPVDKDG